jgi:pyruvate dehydrogenase E1 component alpha subunit
MRFFGHMEGMDGQAYRAADEVDRLRADHDCLDNFARDVLGAGALTADEIAEIDGSVAALVDDAVRVAKAAPAPELSELLTDVYVSY